MSAEVQEIAFETMPLLRREQRSVREPLTAEELQGNAHELGRLRRVIADEKEALKEYAKVKRGEIADLEKELVELIKLGDDGREQMVDCEIRADRDSGRRLVLRTDTHEIIGDEPLSEKDRQPMLFTAPATSEPTTPVEEPTALEGPPSRQSRQAFVDSLPANGGNLVKRLHDAGLLDPIRAHIERFRPRLEKHFAGQTPAYMVGEAESELDEAESALAYAIASSVTVGPGPKSETFALDEIIEIARRVRARGEAGKSRSKEFCLNPQSAGHLIECALVRCLNGRAELEFALEAERAAREPLNAGALDTKDTKVTAEVHPAKKPAKKAPKKAADPPAPEQLGAFDVSAIAAAARTCRGKGLDERVGRWDCPVYWDAHDAGILDPKPDDMERAAAELGRAGQPDSVLEGIADELDALEQDLAADILASSKARIALSRGEFPTNVLKIDVAVGEIRYQRARLGVVVHYGRHER